MQVFDIPTDETLREIRQHGSQDFPFQYYLDDINNFRGESVPWHWHTEFEFVTVSKGTVIGYAGTQKFILHPGQGLFINSGIIHHFESPDHALMPNILFLPDFFASKNSLIYTQYIKPVLSADLPCYFLTPEVPWQKQLLSQFDMLFSTADDPALSHREWHLYAQIQQLWTTFYFHMEPNLSTKTSPHNQLLQARLQKMVEYIAQNYPSKITLDQIAASASISKSEALRCFQATIHTSPIDYLIQYRLSHAAKLLTTTTATITEISLATGFSSTSYFCRLFQKTYHQTPTLYRTQNL